MKHFFVVVLETVMQSVLGLPRFRLCVFLKTLFLRSLGAKVGKRVVIYPKVWIMTGRNLVIGDDVDIALGVLITSDGGVEIGDRTLVGYGTMILSANHRIPNRKSRIFDAGHVKKPVVIANDVWIGANCLILPGAKIGEGAVVAAGSVVTKEVPAFSVVAGVPARVIRDRI